MNIAVIDNYDSFVYNLVHMLREHDSVKQLTVFRNDTFELEAMESFDKILLSPGPGIPSEAGKMPELIKTFAPTKPMLGVCLGHQAIGEAFGASLFNMPEVLHGIRGLLSQEAESGKMFEACPAQFNICHYHSWAIDPATVKGTGLQVTAMDNFGHIMGVEHEKYPVFGLQFHPESIWTEHGATLIDNWLKV